MRQCIHDEVVMDRTDPRGLEKQRRASGGARRLRILPLVADHVGMIQVNVPFEGRFNQETWLGLPAWAMVGLGMWAEEDIVQRELPTQLIMHSIQLAPGQGAIGEAGLVGGGDEQVTRRLEGAQRLDRLWVRLELFEGGWADLGLTAHPDLVKDCVSFDEHRGFHRHMFSLRSPA